MIEARLGAAPNRSSLVLLLAAGLILEEALEVEVRDEISREQITLGRPRHRLRGLCVLLASKCHRISSVIGRNSARPS